MPKYNHPRQKLSRMVTLKLVKNLNNMEAAIRPDRRLRSDNTRNSRIRGRTQVHEGPPPRFASLMLNEEFIMYIRIL